MLYCVLDCTDTGQGLDADGCMMTRSTTGCAVLLLGSLLLCGTSANATVFNIDEIIGSGSVVGTITTDGAMGTLGLSDILSWNLNLTGLGASAPLDSSNSIKESFSPDLGLSVVGSNLFYNYSDPIDASFAIQVPPGKTGATYWCNASYGGDCIQGKSVVPVQYGDASDQIISASGNQVIGVSAAPLPGAWSLMLIGIVAVGFAISHKGRRGKLIDGPRAFR
jgi:hypothetical protein